MEQTDAGRPLNIARDVQKLVERSERIAAESQRVMLAATDLSRRLRRMLSVSLVRRREGPSPPTDPAASR